MSTQTSALELARRRLRRSVHFVPGGSEKMRAKAASLAADSLVLDLEDSVAAQDADKAAARDHVSQWLSAAPTADRERVVRINPLDGPWGVLDLEALVPARPDALMIPKVESGEQLRELDTRLRALERGSGLQDRSIALIVIATETPRAILHIEELATGPRVAALTWGAEDLSAELGSRTNRDADGHYLGVFAYARHLTLIAARAAGVQAIDGVFTDLDAGEGLARECREAADMGFDGKLTIHPDQLAVVNTAFLPSQQELSDAGALIEAYRAHSAAGRGAFRFAGHMVDAPHLARAHRLLARSEAGRDACSRPTQAEKPKHE